MNKVFVIVYEHEDGNSIDSVFFDKELAEKYFDECAYAEYKYRNYSIEEHDIITNLQEEEKAYYITMGKNGNIDKLAKVDKDDMQTETEYSELILNNKRVKLTGIFNGMTKKEAIKKANRKRLELIEKNEWCWRE